MTGRAKKVPNPKACWDGHYDLYVTLPSCRGFHNRLFFYDPTTFATDPRVIGSVTGSVPVETLHYLHVQKNVLSQRLKIIWYECVEKLLRGTEF